MSDTSLYAVQIVLPLENTASVRQSIASLLREYGPHMSLKDKAHVWRQAFTTLASCMDSVTHGVWDYVEDSELADAEFDDWFEGTVDEAREVFELRTKPAEAVDNSESEAEADNEDRYMFVTMLALIRKDTDTDRRLSAVSAMPEEGFWQKPTFLNLLRNFALMNPADVSRDALLMRPREDTMALLQSELDSEPYAYLRPIR